MKLIKFTMTLSIFLFISGIIIYGYSFHNIDIAWNCNYHGFGIDTNPIGIIRTCLEVYQLGLTGIMISLLLILFGYFLLIFTKDNHA